MVFQKHIWLGLGLAVLAASPARALESEKVLNLYSARHYQTDEALYADFTQQTGITVNRVDADDAGIVARLKNEGAASPADVILLVDAARLWSAEDAGLFQPVKSKVLEAAIPVTLRGTDKGQGSPWFGFSTRARVIVYNKVKVQRGEVDTYEKLGDAANKGRVCSRSGSHPYNLSLFGAMLEHQGEAKTESWLKAVVGNMARAPKGGDTDQIRAVATGECGVALSNSYYVARLMRSTKPEDREAMEKVGVIFPNQQTTGTHVNIAGGAMARYAKHPQNAQAFLEYLASPKAQLYFANGNNEYPAANGVTADNPALKALGSFKPELIPVGVVGANTAQVQRMLDRAGYQ